MAMKKAHKDMLKGGLVASAILVFQESWYTKIAQMLGRRP
jgi:hypothetical protein